MVYGTDTILPTDLEYGSPRVKVYSEQGSDTTMEGPLDQLEQARDVALLRSARYQQALRRYHHHRVRVRTFNVGDLVLRRVQSTKGHNKLSPPWEGPYTVAEVLRAGMYKLQIADGQVFINA